MRCCASLVKAWLVGLLLAFPPGLQAGEYATQIIKIDVRKGAGGYVLNARFKYVLSPTARTALYKGVPLSWIIRVKIEQQKFWMYGTIHELRIPYVIQHQALLKQYSVTNLRNQHEEMFGSLNSALKSMSSVYGLKLTGFGLRSDKNYRLAIKVRFDREFLPIPLRPESYLDPQWDLSSDWVVWPKQ